MKKFGDDMILAVSVLEMGHIDLLRFLLCEIFGHIENVSFSEL
jgi:hypothetical protein